MSATQDPQTQRLLVEPAKSGQPHNLMIVCILSWESTTTAGIQIGHLMGESGATPLTRKNFGSIALSQYVHQQTMIFLLTMTKNIIDQTFHREIMNVREVIHLVPATLEE